MHFISTAVERYKCFIHKVILVLALRNSRANFVGSIYLRWNCRSRRDQIDVNCHVSGVPWLIITGSGLDNWIYWLIILLSLLIKINYKCLQSMTV
jgi:hypothetical protein